MRNMRYCTELRASTLSLVAACILAIATNAWAASPECRAVDGSISADLVTNHNVSTGLALGTVTGDLKGAVMATFTTTAGSGGVIELTLYHNFVTVSRASLSTADTGSLTPIPGMSGVYHMAVTYRVTGGTGKFAGATGTLQNHGTADLNTGLLTLTYTGEICTPGEH
jgi:hypothetical protein